MSSHFESEGVTKINQFLGDNMLWSWKNLFCVERILCPTWEQTMLYKEVAHKSYQSIPNCFCVDWIQYPKSLYFLFGILTLWGKQHGERINPRLKEFSRIFSPFVIIFVHISIARRLRLPHKCMPTITPNPSCSMRASIINVSASSENKSIFLNCTVGMHLCGNLSRRAIEMWTNIMTKGEKIRENSFNLGLIPVSYTHLTLPTKA